ncbi:carboxypeptidase-like regulatory domain-containing protein [Shewanella waksmanii]|uniref:carboxypeptidase-like regulatory domain-containing protein n=1 Tax=Shewanella waksmanii TaxID=213783 RepID=UPI0037353938
MQFKTVASLSLIAAFASSSLMAEQAEIRSAKYQQSNQTLTVKGRLERDRGSSSPNRGNKLVEVVDGANPNVVLASIQAKRSFRARIDQSDLAYMPCEIGVVVEGNIDDIVYAPIVDAPAQCGGYATTLTGLITDEPIPYATVSVTIGGQTYTTTADANGAYSLDIVTANLDELLVIESSAINEQTGDEINFVNMVGSFSRVLSDPDPVNVTNVTTASYALVVEANGGSAPTTAEELATAETAVDATELFELAAVIKLIVDDPNYSLPDGYDSVLDLVSDEAAVDAYIAATPQEDLNAAVEDILSDSELVAGFDLQDIPSLYYAIAVTTPGYIARAGSALEFDTVNATGNALSFSSPTGQPLNQAFTWQLNNGRIEVVYTSPEAVEELVSEIEDVTDDAQEITAFYAAGGVNEDFFTERTTTQRAYTRVVDGNLVDVVSVEVRSTLVTPPITLADGSVLTIAAPKLVIGNENETFRSSLDITPIAFEASCTSGVTCIQGDWGGVYHYSEGPRVYDDYIFPESAYAELITFAADNTTEGEISGVSANWALDNEGRLVITYANGMVQTSQILDQNALEFGVFSSFENGSERFASYDIWVRGDDNFALDTNYLLPTAVTRFWAGEVNTWIPGSIEANGLVIPSRLWGWAFTVTDVSNTFATQWSDPDSNGESTLAFVSQPPVSFIENANSIVINRFDFAKRYWFPIASTVIDGERVFYVIEREERDAEIWYGGEPGFKTFIPSRMNIERERDMADYTNIVR